MIKKSLLDCEASSLEKLRSFQISHHWRKFGIGLAILGFVLIGLNKFVFDLPSVRLGAKYGLIIGLLLVSISKEKIEDELVSQLRMQSYSLAFIVGVAFTLLVPLTSYIINLLTEPGNQEIKSSGDLSILSMFLLCQVGYFELFKRLHK